ncbi:MAG TPA: hypothetical protein VF223_13915 [Trebonia sp.]
MSSVTYARPEDKGSGIVRQGPCSAAIRVMSLNSVGEPMASPIARPSKVPAAARFTLSLAPWPPWPTVPPLAGTQSLPVRADSAACVTA